MNNWIKIAQEIVPEEYKKFISGRRPESVKFSTIDKDVKRRDLTINALFYDLQTGEVVDYVGGIEDIRNRIIKAVGDANERFKEDRLRILRTIRFASRFDSKLSPEVEISLKKDSSLEGISFNRIRDEFVAGIKSAKRTKYYLGLLDKFDLFKWIFGNNLKISDFVESNNPVIVIASLLQLNGTDFISKELNKRTYSKDEVEKIVFFINFLLLNINNAFVLKKEQIHTKVSSEEILQFSLLNKMQMDFVNAFIKYNLSVKAQEFMEQGFKGKDVGDKIKEKETQIFKNLL